MSDQTNGFHSEASPVANGLAKHSNEAEDEEIKEEKSTSSSLSPPSLNKKWNGLCRKEVVVLLYQTLVELGYRKTSRLLEDESGIVLESSITQVLRCSILKGEWNLAVKHLEKVGIDQFILNASKFLVYEQKFMELLYQEDISNALYCLRNEFSVSCFDGDTSDRLHKCCSLLMCQGTEDLYKRTKWRNEGSRNILWSKIQQLFPPDVVPPAKRFETIAHQAWRLQELHCLYHNPSVSTSYSLLEDHECPRLSLPTHKSDTVEAHSNEIWNIVINSSGTQLASSSKDTFIILWEISGGKLSFVRRWHGHSDPVNHLSWSPNDELLASASDDGTIMIWSPNLADAKYSLRVHQNNVTSVCWLPNSIHALSTGFDKNLILWKLIDQPPYYEIIHTWFYGCRLHDCAVSYDGKYAIVVACEQLVRVVDLESLSNLYNLYSMTEHDLIMSVTPSSLNHQILLNGRDGMPVIRLLDLDTRKVIQNYRGHSQSHFILRASFGGPNETFILSGSEDCSIYIWHRFQGSLLEVLDGHAAVVNVALWPASPNFNLMFSASDDGNLIVWRIPPDDVKNCAAKANRSKQSLLLSSLNGKKSISDKGTLPLSNLNLRALGE